MRSRAIVFSLAVGVLVPLGSAQNSSQDELPSAPSAVIIEKQQQARPAPKPKPAESPKPQPTPPSQPTTSQPTPTEATSIPAPPAGASAGASPASAPPPSSNTADDSPLATIRKRVDEVNVIFTVTDKRGRYVKNMTKDDFRILDDKTPQQQVVNFRSETDLPLRVGLLIDASNSVVLMEVSAH